ncbi:Rib/alpha-like domain-containing protein, partial [Streptococcus oralis]
MFKPKGHHVRQSQVEKFTRYSIRKVSFGAASVAVATGLFFLGGGSVQAAEPVTNPEHTEVQNPQNVNEKSPEPSKVVSGQESATDKAVDVQKTSSAKESATDTQASAVETPNVVTEKVAINTASLEDLVAKAESRLSQLTEGKKTKSVIDDAKNLVNKAKDLLNDDTKTQEKVDALAKQLSSSLVILNSIKSETTEEKETKNQDPRNGQAIPGKGESGFRTDSSNNDAATTSTTTTGTSDTITPTNPAQPTAKDIIGSTSTVSRENFTGWDTYTMPFGSHHDGEGDLGVNTPEKKADAEGLEFRVFSDQRAGTRPSPGPSNYTYLGKENDVKARIDYGLKLPAEKVQKIIEEAPLWRGKQRYDGTTISRQVPATYYGNGPYEYLLSSIYKLGYEQGIDKVYVKDVSKRIEVTEAAKKAGWTVSDFNVFNFPNGLFYDKATDSVQGVVTHRSPFNYQQVKARVTFKNTITGKSVTIPLDDHRFGGTAWKDGTPPTLEINNAVKEGKVGEALTVPVEYRDAGASHAGVPNDRRVSYTLTNENGDPIGRTTTITETVGRAILGVSGAKITGTIGGKEAATPTELTENETKIPGVGFTLASADMTENNPNGFKGTPTEAGIYRVSIYARDYQTTNANEAYAHATFKIAPEVTIKNVHAYDTEVPITISRGASEATITLPDGTNTKVVAKDGKWVVSETTNTAVNVNDEIGTVGETFNLKVLPTATANAATDTINVTANSENITATFTRAEVALKTRLGENVSATFNKVTGRWELSGETAEKKTLNSDGTTTWLKRDLYVDVNKDGETIFNVYEYTRTLNAEGKVTAVDNVSRTLTTYNKENAANSSADSATDTNKGMVVTVRYDKGLNKWTADDNSTVTATKTGDKWTISTTSGFSGTIDAVETASTSDKASVLNDAPSISSSSYTTVKGATVDLVKQKSAAVTITDTEDDATTAPNKKETTVTKVTLTSPSGTVTEYSSAAEVAAVKLSEVGTYTVKVEVKDSNGNVVTADTETDTGTNKGADTAVNSTTYTITVKDQETNKLYTVEGDTVTNDQLKEKVNPTAVEGFTPTKNDITDIPTTADKAGQTLPTTATVTYTKDTETIQVETKVDVVVLPKVTPEGVKVLKDSTGLEEVVKAKATEAATATTKLPDGVTVRVKEIKAGTVPATTATGVQTPATAVVEYVKDGNVVASKEVPVPVTVVGSTASNVVVFEGDTVEAKTVQDAVTPGTDGTKGNPAIPEDLTKTTGKKEVTVPVTYEGIEAPEQVKVPVTVLPVAKGEVTVPKGETTDKVKEVAKAKAEEVANSADFKAKLPDGAKDVEVGAITEEVLAAITSEAGSNKGTVKVPVTYTVDGVKYTKDAAITVNVVGSNADPVYVVEGDKPEVAKVKDAVKPGEGGTLQDPMEVDLPNTNDKVGATDVTVPTKVKYANGEETVKVPVTVLPKVTPEGVKVLKDSTGLEEVVKAKATEAATATTKLPDGVTVRVKEVKAGTVPATTATGVQTPATAVVEYVKDGNVVATKEVTVPVTVVGSTPSNIVVFEGEKPTADQAKAAVTPGTDGTKGEPTTLPETAGKAGATDVKVDVPVTYDNGKLTETVSVPVTVLPKPEADEILVAKNSDKEKAKEKVLAQAEKAIADGTFTGKLPQGATVTVDNTVPVTIPELTDDTEVEVTVKYTVPGQDKPLTTTVKVPVTVVEGVPQIVPVDESNKQPDPEKNIDKTDYPEGSTFRYKTPDGQTTPIDVTTTGDKNVIVEVLDPQGNTIVEVPATVRVVGSTPQFVVADPTKKQPEAKDSVTPGEYPDGTTFEYKTPVDTTTAGEKDVTVVAKLNGQPIAEVPAKVVVVDPKTQYVVADPSKPQPDASKSIDPEQYPDGTTFEYKTPVDTTTPGEKDVVVVAKDGEDKLVEVPTKVKVVQGNPQIVPVDEDKKQPSPEDSIDPNDYPDDATFEYKEEVDTSKPGDKKVTVVVKQGDKVLVEVPATVRVVESYPQFVPVDKDKKQPAVEGSIDPKAFPKDTEFTYETPVDTTTPGEKDVVVVAKIGDKVITKVPAKVMVVEPKTQYVPVDKSNKQPDASKSIDPEQYPDGITFEYKTPVDTTTPGEKDVVVVAKDGDDTLVEVPTKVKVVQGYPQIVPVDEGKKQPSPEDSIDSNDYPDDATFEYKEEVDTSKPGDKKVTVVVKQGDKVLVEVPATVRVVESYPQFVPVDKDKKQPAVEGSIDPKAFPKDTEFTYETPVDTTTPGEKDVVVVAKIGDKVITKVPAKVMVVEPKTQYVPVDKSNKQPDASKSIDPEQYPDGVTFNYKNPVDTTRPGEKDVIVEAKDGDDTLVEVPTKVKVVEGKEQLIPVNPTEKPQARDNITPSDYPEGSTFEYKIPDGQKEPFDVTTVGDKPVTVLVKDKNGKVLVEVPATIKVVEAKPTPIETPVTNTPLTNEDIAKYVKVPEGGKVTNVENIPDLTTPGKKDPVKVTVELPNRKTITVDVPVNVTPVKEIETPVTSTPLTPEDYTRGIKIPEGGKVTNVEN